MQKIGIVAVLVFLVLSCSETKEKTTEPEKKEEKEQIAPPTIGDTAIVYSNGAFDSEVLIKAPKAPFKGTILVLQGWNFPNTSWCDSSDLCERASELGYFLVMPYVGKSIYHKKVYPQTRKDWHMYPTRTWLMEHVVADLQERYHLFAADHKNFVMGLSTGGRGSLILAEENPDIFAAGASLSGDYDQSEFPKDNLYKGFFGADSSQWTADENPVSTIEDWKVPMYIGHGAQDSVVSVQHMVHLRVLLWEKNPNLKTEIRQENNAGHNYAYWAGELENIFGFFGQFTE